jgi:hypothetical protein
VHKLLRFLTKEVVAPWIINQREACGVAATVTGSDALASPPLTSPAILREFCLQYIQELEKSVGKIRLAGLFGESRVHKLMELLEIKRQGCSQSIQVLDPDASRLGPAFFRDYARKSKASLIMGIDAHLGGSGSIDEIESRARWFVEEAGLQGRFVLFINDIPYDIPPENVRAVVSVAREYRADPSGTEYVRMPAQVT